jgi:signal transduction histidine kinase
MSLQGDGRLLRRMLRNLLENAARHGVGSDEPVKVALSREPFGGEDVDEILLEVLDRGPGVPADARERIFEAFYRIDGHSEQAGGVGLGLALVKQIAQAHGGSVGCDAREGGGSRFWVRLPVSRALPDDQALRPTTTG